MLASWLQKLYSDADALNRSQIADLVAGSRCVTMCDLGCDDGAWTAEIAKRSRSQTVVGIEINPARARLGHTRGVRVIVADLNQELPFQDQVFDFVHSNQVMEHVKDVDRFISEIARVLRVGGVGVISTENASSWHNIFASILGWQIFSLTSVSSRARSIGNPLALHKNDTPPHFLDTHRTIFNYRGLIDIFKVHGFAVQEVRGSGYYPFPARLGRIDVRHSHFITVKVRKGASTASADQPRQS